MKKRIMGDALPERSPRFLVTQLLEECVVAAGIAAGSTEGEVSHECEAVLLGCLRRIRRWRLPPRWSARDWFEEIAAELTFAALQAARDFDSARGVRREVFLRQRIMHRAYNRYHREWMYAIRQVARAEFDRHAKPKGRERTSTEAEAELLQDVQLLQDALGRLSRSDFSLIEGIFWGGKTEFELAKVLGVSQQAVSKRKRMIFKTLHHLIQEIARKTRL